MRKMMMTKMIRRMKKTWTLANWTMTAGEVTVEVTAIVLGMDVRPPSQHSELTRPAIVSALLLVSTYLLYAMNAVLLCS